MLLVGDFAVSTHEKAVMCLTEKAHVLDFCSGMNNKSEAVSVMLMNQQYKVSLKRNIHKIRLCIDCLMEM